MSSRARVAEHRKNVKANPEKYQAYLRKEKERNEKRRKKLKEKLNLNNDESQKLRESLKKYETFRKRNYRKKMKEKQASSSTPTSSGTPSKKAYSCPQSFGKAVSKARKAMPKSPTKRKAVTRKLLEELHPESKKIFFPKKREAVSSKQVEDKVIQFYERDDISRQEPGKRDVCSVKDPVTGKRSHYQKRILLMRISEIFEMFALENPDKN